MITKLRSVNLQRAQMHHAAGLGGGIHEQNVCLTDTAEKGKANVC